MSPADLVPTPYRLLGGAVALVAVVAGVLAFGVHRYSAGDAAGYARGHAEALAVQGRWEAERAYLAQKALADEADQRRIEQRKTDEAQESHDEYLKTLAQARAAADDLRAERDGLRAALAAADVDAASMHPSATGANPPTRVGPDDAATLRQLLGACSGRYADVAAAADVLRVQVSGLQGYVKAACAPSAH